ncbi:MAG: peptide-methionine (S)-S-oxide reductase MsrA [Christensenellaceae bacterium]
MKEIYLAGGCFWGMQRYFEQIQGVIDTQVGYANGNIKNPTYENVCMGKTNFAETLYVRYDETKVTLLQVLALYFKAIDPTTLNRQGNDVGTQYRTGIYYVDEADKETIKRVLKQEQKNYQRTIQTEVKELHNYYPAEEYHQKYLRKHPNGYCHIGKEEFDYARNFKYSV